MEPDYVARCLQLAVLLEVSAYPKPGNVHRTRDFSDTRYEHFLASAVALYPHFREAARRGVECLEGVRGLSDVGVGEVVKKCVEDMLGWQRGGNTHLGTILLLVPMAVAAGMIAAESFSPATLRRNLTLVVKSTTPRDAVMVYDAISAAGPGGLGRAPKLDVRDESSRREILEKGITLYEIFEIASSYDSVAYEWVSGYRITFEVGYPFLVKELEKAGDINVAVVNTFLRVMAEVPDTLIARKFGAERARDVSLMARRALEKGGLATREGRRVVYELDDALHSAGLNPGTTADLVCSCLAVLTLGGYRP